MAIINLYPSAKQPKKSKAKSPQFQKVEIPFKSLLFIPPLVLGIAFSLWVFLFFQTKTKENALQLMSKNMAEIKDRQKQLDGLKKTKEELSLRISSFQNVYKERIIWSEKLSVIHKLMPPQIWLTSLKTEKVPDKTLIIDGAATSLAEQEIIESISLFVSKLKDNSAFKKSFSNIKLGQVNAEKRGNLTVMKFNLSCTFIKSEL